jgi:hypothetical protein
MPFSLRALLLAVALLTSGALQVAAAVGEDACCAEEQEQEAPLPCSGCPPGVACACCPSTGAVASSGPEVAPASSKGVGVVTAPPAPSALASASDIFHPPRA